MNGRLAVKLKTQKGTEAFGYYIAQIEIASGDGVMQSELLLLQTNKSRDWSYTNIVRPSQVSLHDFRSQLVGKFLH